MTFPLARILLLAAAGCLSAADGGVEAGDPRLPFTYRAQSMVSSWQGGGPQDKPLWELHGATIEGDGLLLVADRLTYEAATGEIEAFGHIRVEGTGLRLRCERLRMNWKRKDGEAFAVELEVEPDWTLRSRRVAFSTVQPRPGEELRVKILNHWFFEQVQVSACPQQDPDWSAQVGRLDADLNGFATLRDLWVHVGRMPTPAYFPWLLFPAKPERTPGLLAIKPGRSTRNGVSLGLPYYQPLGDQVDVTVTPEFYSRAGTLWGLETRWALDPSHSGTFTGQWIHERPGVTPRADGSLDPSGEKRYRFNLRELWQREDNWTLGADINHASDTFLDVDYDRGIGSLGANAFDSSFFLGRTFAAGSMALTAGDQRTFFQVDDPLYRASFPTSFRRQTLPSLSLRAYPVEWGNFYVDGGARMGHHLYRLQLGEPGSGLYEWNRGDAFTRMQGRLGQWGPMRADLQLMGRYTRYSGSLGDPVFSEVAGENGFSGNAALNPFKVDGPGLERQLFSSRLKLAAPQFGRLFEQVSLFGYQGDLKHVLEPFVALTANSRFGSAARVPRFDEVDGRPGVEGTAMGEQSLEIGARQHLFGRPGTTGSFLDLVRLRTSVRYHFQPILLPDGRTQRKGWGSVDNELDVEPSDQVRISFRRSSDVDSSNADNALSADVKLGRAARYSLAWFSTGLNRFLVRQRGLQVGGDHAFLEDQLRLEFRASYDFSRRRFSAAEVATAHVTPCIATTLRFSRVVLADIPGGRGRENRLFLTFTLRGLGAFGLSY